MCDTQRMNGHDATPTYKRQRFPPAIIGHAVWLYFRFALSYRDVEELLAERGVILTYETVRQWCRKFGQTYANALRRRRPRPGDTWHLDLIRFHGRVTIRRRRFGDTSPHTRAGCGSREWNGVDGGYTTPR